MTERDVWRYELPRNVGIKLNDKDTSRAKELLNYKWFQKKPWQQEIKRMLSSGLKVYPSCWRGWTRCEPRQAA